MAKRQTTQNKPVTVYIQSSGNPVIMGYNEGQVIKSYAGGSTDIVDQVAKSGAAIAAVCDSLYQNMTQALTIHPPTEFAVEFGLTLTGSAGIPFVTSGTAEAAFKVTATWKSEKVGKDS